MNNIVAVAASIARTLDANHADLSLVADMADTLIEFGFPQEYRAGFVTDATKEIVKDANHQARMLDLEINRKRPRRETIYLTDPTKS